MTIYATCSNVQLVDFVNIYLTSNYCRLFLGIFSATSSYAIYNTCQTFVNTNIQLVITNYSC